MRQIATLTIFVFATLMIVGNGCRGKQQSPALGQDAQRPTPTNSPVLAAQPIKVPLSSLATSPTPRIIRRHRETTNTKPYLINQGSVYFPGFDDVPRTSQPRELMRLEADAFSRTTHVYDKRAICTRPNNETTTFTLPSEAQQIGLVCRARSVEEEWPRVRISLVDAANASQRCILFEGNIHWKELRYLWMPVPEGFRNRLVYLKLEILNPNYYFSQRALYIAYVVIARAE
ncbi:MAG: hypothetical protein N2Z21_02985 [Candidatus Sumerlaeaceae bacterium]|nr:hypothetical protein [Candidatus Sumerlaeaceae bacterium]